MRIALLAVCLPLCLLSGCPSQDTKDPCAAHATCDACGNGAAECGWCGNGAGCLTGSSTGPEGSQCTSADWTFTQGHCPAEQVMRLTVEELPCASGTAAGTCCAKLAAKSVSDGFCTAFQHVRDNVGTLQFACSGGTASARFEDTTLMGDYTSGVLNVSWTSDPSTFNGCPFHATERLSGDVLSGTVRYTYDEFLDANCPNVVACSRAGDVTVQKP